VDPKGQTKRWFKNVSVDEFNMKGFENPVYRILVDDRVILTPENRPLYTPSRLLSYAVAAEWDMQHKYITPHMMPLMSICCTTLDSVPVKRNHAISTILGYILTDTLCYRAKRTTAKRLYDLQLEYHQPVVEWFQSRFNCKINIVEDGRLEEAKQPDILFQRVRWHLNEMSDWELAAIYHQTENAKSFILALALTENIIDLNWAMTASRAEESFQISQFGLVEGEHDVLDADIRVKLGASVFFGRLVYGLTI